MSAKVVRLWNSDDEDINVRMERCVEAYTLRPHKVAQELILLRDENRALLRELAVREEQIAKMANALANDEVKEILLN